MILYDVGMKKKLSDRQLRRIQQVQDAYADRAARKQARAEATLESTSLGMEQRGLVIHTARPFRTRCSMPHVPPRRGRADVAPTAVAAAAASGGDAPPSGAGASLRELAADAWNDWSACAAAGIAKAACADASHSPDVRITLASSQARGPSCRSYSAPPPRSSRCCRSRSWRARAGTVRRCVAAMRASHLSSNVASLPR